MSFFQPPINTIDKLKFNSNMKMVYLLISKLQYFVYIKFNQISNQIKQYTVRKPFVN